MNKEVLAQCRWPVLVEKHDRALRKAVEFILDTYAVSGIIVAGRIIDGNAHPSSDLDIYVVHTRAQRQRVQKRFSGVAVEIFVNPPASIRGYFQEERDRPCTANMLANGFVVLERDPVVGELRTEAQDWLQRSPDLLDHELTWHRYAAADTYENAQDIEELDPENATRILHAAVDQMLRYRFLAANHHLPRDKEFLAALQELDAKLGELARSYYAAEHRSDRFAYAEQIADSAIHNIGFFEWTSPLEDVEE